MSTTTFKFDEQTERLFELLKRDFNASSKAEIVRKALALLEIARRAKAEGKEISVTTPDGKVVKTYELV
jgi:hypothetical protein